MRLVETCDWKPLIVEDTGGRLVLRGLAGLAGVPNANKRRYSEKLWKKILGDKDVLERINNRKMVGELDHPSDGQTRIERGSHLITKLDMVNGNQIWGTEEVLTTPHGKILREYVANKVTLGTSTRGDGTVTEGDDGISEVNEDYHLETYDHVLNPSTPGAYVSSSKVEMVTREVAPLMEAVERLIKSGGCNSEDLKTYASMIERMLAQTDEALVSKRAMLEKAQSSILRETQRCSCHVPKTVEVNKRMDTHVTESSADARVVQISSQLDEANKLNAKLQSDLQEVNKKLAAASSVGEELRISALQHKLRAEHFEKIAHATSDSSRKLEWMKKLVKELARRVKNQPVLERRYAAAEKLIAAFISKAGNMKLESAITSLLKNERKEFVDAIRPVLLEAGDTKKAEKLFEVIKQTSGRRADPTLPTGRTGVVPIREVRSDKPPIRPSEAAGSEIDAKNLPTGVTGAPMKYAEEAAKLAQNLHTMRLVG